MHKADLVVTDPPYNVEIVGGNRSESKEVRKKKGKLTIENDKMDDCDFLNFLTEAFKRMLENMNDGASFYIFYADSEGLNFRLALKNAGFTLRQTLIWNKSSLVIGKQDYQWKHEPCLYGWKDGASHKWYSDRCQTTVMDFDRPMRNSEHPTMKPVELIAYQIKNSSKENDIVLDLFGGSGSTLIACEQTKRKCYTMELDPKYCEVIIKRWETLTGKKAILN